MVDIKVVDKKMTITVDLEDNNWAVSKSQKSMVISTKGFAPVDGTNYKVSMNIIKPKE